MNAKSLLVSKTFWFNIITALLEVANVLPPAYAAPILVVGNLVLRVLTNQPVTLALPFLK